MEHAARSTARSEGWREDGLCQYKKSRDKQGAFIVAKETAAPAQGYNFDGSVSGTGSFHFAEQPLFYSFFFFKKEGNQKPCPKMRVKKLGCMEHLGPSKKTGKDAKRHEEGHEVRRRILPVVRPYAENNKREDSRRRLALNQKRYYNKALKGVLL